MHTSPKDHVALVPTPLAPDQLCQALRHHHPSAGAFVSFEGWVRNHNEGKNVLHLEYEAYIPMAEKVIQAIIQEIKKKFSVEAIHVYHRVGRLKIGDIAVWVGVCGAHRKESFQACETVMGELKHRAPIWKKETYQNHSTEWISCAQSKCS